MYFIFSFSFELKSNRWSLQIYNKVLRKNLESIQDNMYFSGNIIISNISVEMYVGTYVMFNTFTTVAHGTDDIRTYYQFF